MVSSIHIIGVLLTVTLLVAVSWLSGRKVKDAHTFTTGGNAGSWMVCGAMLGTLAGGQSTIGTAQLAFCYGLSAWWFPIGAGLGAVVLGLFYAGPLRRSGCTTLLEIVSREYGHKAETVGSILFLIGIFISIMSQVLSSSAMIGSLFGMTTLWSSIAGAVLILLMVLFGGIRSAGVGGIIKLILLYLCSLAAGIVVWHIAGGLTGLRDGVDAAMTLDRFGEKIERVLRTVIDKGRGFEINCSGIPNFLGDLRSGRTAETVRRHYHCRRYVKIRSGFGYQKSGTVVRRDR